MQKDEGNLCWGLSKTVVWRSKVEQIEFRVLVQKVSSPIKTSKGRVAPSKWSVFGKVPNGLWPPPSFLENHIENLFQFHAQKALFQGPKSAI